MRRVSRAPSPQGRPPWARTRSSSASHRSPAVAAGGRSSYPRSPVYPVRQTVSGTPRHVASANDMYPMPKGSSRSSSTSSARGALDRQDPVGLVLVGDPDPRGRGGREPAGNLRAFAAFGTSRTSSSERRYTIRSSTTPPDASSQQRLYCARPGPIRPRALVRQASTKAAAPGPPDAELAQVAHVEQADLLTDRLMLAQHAAARVLDRHLPPAEVGELRAESDVAIVQGGAPAGHAREPSALHATRPAPARGPSGSAN